MNVPRTPRIPQRPAFYARISQDRSGLSLGVTDQIAEGKRHLAALGWPEPMVYDDNDISARSGRPRPDFERLLRDIESGVVDGLAARHLDRLLRRVSDLERVLDAIESQRVPLPVLLVEGSEIDLSSASGRLLARILASVAANESEIKGERVGAARRREAHAGRAHGRLGYGYDRDQQLVPEEAAIIREVATRVFDEQSLRSIAVDLNARGVATPGAGRWDARRVQKTVARGERRELAALIGCARSDGAVTPAEFARALNKAGAVSKWTAERVRGQAWCGHLEADDHGLDDSMIAGTLRDAGIPADATGWRAANLRAMIRRGALCGWREFSPGKRGGSGELVAKGDWTPILTKETVEEIRRVTDRPGVRGRDPKHLLAGFLKCGVCGSSMGGSPDGRGGSRYACSKQPGLGVRCGGITITGAQVDAMVSLAVVDTLADAGVRAGVKRKARATGDTVDAEQELIKVAALREDYAREAAAGGLTPGEWRTLRDGLNARHQAAQRVLGSWAPASRLLLHDVPTGREEIQQWWPAQSITRQREYIHVLIESIPIFPANGARRFDPARVGDPIWKV